MSNFLRASPRLYGVDNPSTNSHSKTKQENNARVNASTQPHNLNKETHVRNIPDLYVQLADAIDGTFLDLLTLDIHVVCMRHTSTQWIAWCVSEFGERQARSTLMLAHHHTNATVPGDKTSVIYCAMASVDDLLSLSNIPS